MATKKLFVDINDAKRRIIAFAAGCHTTILTIDTITMLLNQTPTVEAVEMAQGHWIEHPNVEILDGKWISNYECSECLCWYRNHENYCGFCGAKMDGENNEHS